jgi:hypothetical protein
MDENIPTIDPDELFGMYEQRIREQTSIIFTLVGKLGGSVLLSQEDFQAYPEYNTVDAREQDGHLVLELKYEDQ